MNDITPLELLTEDQIKELLRLINGNNNNNVPGETWENMIRFLDGKTPRLTARAFADLEDVIRWLKY